MQLCVCDIRPFLLLLAYAAFTCLVNMFPTIFYVFQQQNVTSQIKYVSQVANNCLLRFKGTISPYFPLLCVT